MSPQGMFEKFGLGMRLVSCPACEQLPARNGLVNEVKFHHPNVVITNEIGNYYVALPLQQ